MGRRRAWLYYSGSKDTGTTPATAAAVRATGVDADYITRERWDADGQYDDVHV